MYDRKKRRQLWKKDESTHDTDENESLFDIFLCDLCDATFVSEEAYTVSLFFNEKLRFVK